MISIVSICLFLRGSWPTKVRWKNYWILSAVNSCPKMSWRKIPKSPRSHRSWFSFRRKPLTSRISHGRVTSFWFVPVKVFNWHWIPRNWPRFIWWSLVPIIGKTQSISFAFMLVPLPIFNWSPNRPGMKTYVGRSTSCLSVFLIDLRMRQTLLSLSLLPSRSAFMS